MKAALCRSLDGPSAVVVADIPEPLPLAGEAVVRVSCAGLNHADVLRARGKYQEKPELPFSPCGEIAGVVEAAPAGSGFIAGSRVMAYVGHGGARERTIIEPWRLVPIPDGVSDVAACGIPVTYGTALHALRERARLQAGQTVAVLGAGGGAGLAAVEIAKLMGARVLAVASVDKHRACLRHGADAVIDRDVPDLKRALRELSEAGPDVIYDCVGGALSEPAFRSLRSGGSLLVVGFASRTVPVLPLDIALVKSLSILGINWPAAVESDRAGYRADMALALEAVAEGRLSPAIHGSWPIDEICSALAVLDRGEATGKIVIKVD